MKSLKKILTEAAVYYTCLSLLLLAVNLCATAAAGDALNRAPIPALTFFLLFPFGICMSVGRLLLQRYTNGLGRLLHYLITLLSLWIFLWIPSKPQGRASTTLLLLAFVTLLYWVVVGISALIKHRFRRIMKDSDLN